MDIATNKNNMAMGGLLILLCLLLSAALGSEAAAVNNECSLASGRHNGSALVQTQFRSRALPTPGLQEGRDRSHAAGDAKDFVVDLVYTWAGTPTPGDGYYEEIDATCGLAVSRNSGPHKDGINRFRDNADTLKFSIISVGRHLPWVRKIFIVTNDGALPSWLSELEANLTSKVAAVSHRDIWPVSLRATELPTHNSNAIEANLHRIPGLAEHFIYMNDDMFIGRELSRSEFFSDRGRVIWQTAHVGVPYLDNEQQLRDLTEKGLTLSVGGSTFLEPLSLLHQAKPYTKSGMQAMHAVYTEALENASSQRCRPTNGSDFVPFYALNFFQVQKGLAEVVPLKGDLDASVMMLDWAVLMRGDEADRVWYDRVARLRPKLFCINDDFSQEDAAYSKQVSRLNAFLNSYFGQQQAQKLTLTHQDASLQQDAKEFRGKLDYLPLTLLSLLMVAAVSPILVSDGVIPFVVVLGYLVALTLVRTLVKQTLNEGYGSSSWITVLHMFVTSTVAVLIDRPLIKEAIPTVPIALVVGLGIALGNRALVYSTLAFAGMIGTCSPAVTFFLELFTGRRKSVTAQTVVSLTMVIAGGLLCAQGETSYKISGLLLILGALLCRSMKIIWQQDLLQMEMPPMHVVAWSSIWTTVYMLPVALYSEGLSALVSIPSLPWRALGPLAASAVCAAVLNICQVYAVKYLGSLMQNIVGNLTIIMVIASGTTFLGETITAHQYYGMSLMALGVTLFKATKSWDWPRWHLPVGKQAKEGPAKDMASGEGHGRSSDVPK